jgi:hypothetical protein
MVRGPLLEGVPVLPAMRLSCSNIPHRVLRRASLAQRGECGLGNPSGGGPLNIVVFQTAPAVVHRQQAQIYEKHSRFRVPPSESTPLLEDYQPPSHPPCSTVEAPPLSALCTVPVLIAILNLSLLALSDMSLSAILPLYLASTPLSLTPRAIGVFMGGMGIYNGVFQVLCTAPLVERWGAKRAYQAAICAFLPLWALFPMAASLASVDGGNSYPWAIWLLAALGMILVPIVDMSFSEHFQPQPQPEPGPAVVVSYRSPAHHLLHRHHLPLRSRCVPDARSPRRDQRPLTDHRVAHARGRPRMCHLVVCGLERTPTDGRTFSVFRVLPNRCRHCRGLVPPP